MTMLEYATVLMADDDENDVTLMQRAFVKARIPNPLQIVRDGGEAIAYLRGEAPYADREKFPLPGLVLLDLKMPKKSGFEVLEWIRAEPAMHRMVVILLTTSNQMLDVNHGYDLGANSYVVKPSDMDTLLTMLRTVQGYWLSLNQRPNLDRQSTVAQSLSTVLVPRVERL